MQGAVYYIKKRKEILITIESKNIGNIWTEEKHAVNRNREKNNYVDILSKTLQSLLPRKPVIATKVKSQGRNWISSNIIT